MYMGFVISATAVASEDNFNTMKEIIKQMIEEYGKERISYSVIVFGDAPRVTIRFNDGFAGEEDIKTFVDGIANTPRGSALDKALKEAKTQFDQGARDQMKKILVVITDRRSDSTAGSVKIAAKPLEESGIKVIAVAIGTEADTNELEETTADERNVIDAKKKPNPKELAEKIMQRAIEGLLQEWRLDLILMFAIDY